MLTPRLRPLSLLFALGLTAVSFGESHAQPRSTAAAASQNSARGVSLSEVSKFGNLASVSYEVMPFGEDFYVATVIDEQYRTGMRSAFQELAELQLYRYTADLRRDEGLRIAWPNEPRDHIGIVSVGEHFVWTFATFEDKRDEVQLRAEILDGDGKLLSAHKLVTVPQRDYQSDRIVSFDDYTPSRSHYVRVYGEVSENRVLSKRDDERASVTVLVVDEEGQVVTNKRQRLNANRDQLEIQKVTVDRDGRAYILAKVFDNTKGRELRGGSDARLYLYTMDAGAEDFVTTELELEGQYIQGVSMVPNDKGSPAIVGLYADRIGRRIRGYFSSDDVRSGQTLVAQPFSQEVLAKLGPRATSRVGGELALEQTFEFRDALQLTNGRLSLLLEGFQVRRDNSYYNGFGPSFYNPYRFGNGQFGGQNLLFEYQEGLILNFDTRGELTDALTVPKFQTTPSPNLPYARMNLVEYEGKAAVIYNDNPKNFTRDLDRNTKGTNWNDALAVLGYDRGDGELLRVPLFARRDAGKVIIVPRSATRLADDRILFLATRYKTFGGNELRFGIIDPARG